MRMKTENEITVRTKINWLKKLWRRAAGKDEQAEGVAGRGEVARSGRSRECEMMKNHETPGRMR